jgi:hypothetical protein
MSGNGPLPEACLMLSQKASNGMVKQKAPNARRAIVEHEAYLRTSKQRGNRSNAAAGEFLRRHLV